MFSRSKHHHERQLSSSPPPPTLGTRRQRSPESVPLEPAGENALNKISPQSQRTTKRGRLTSPQREGSASPSPSPFPAQHCPSDEGQTAELDRSTSCSVAQVVAEETKHLELLLDSVLATLAIIQTASTTPIALSKHSREALSVLNKITTTSSSSSAPPGRSPDAVTHPKKSYASVATRPHIRTAHKARSLPAGQTPRHTTPVNDNRPPHHPPSTSWLIVSWEGNPVPHTSMSLSRFVEYLNFELSPGSK